MDARRQMHAVITFVVVVTAGALVLGYLAGSRPGSPWIPVLVAGLSSLVLALLLGLTVWLVNRATVADRRVRARIHRALRDRTELPPDEQPLAIAEATRIHRSARAMTLMGAGGALLNTGRLILELGGRRPFSHLAVTVMAILCLAALATHQQVLRRRAGAYLSHFSPPDRPAG